PLFQGVPDPLDHSHAVLEGRVGKQDEELLATVAVDRVGGANRATDRRRDGLEDLVAGEMAIVVVEALEEVDVAHRDAPTAPVGPGFPGREILAQPKPIAEPGEWVPAGIA